jgi:hypothetical protein
VKSVTVYPTQFGLQRMEEEKRLGPSIFCKDNESSKFLATGQKAANADVHTSQNDDASSDEVTEDVKPEPEHGEASSDETDVNENSVDLVQLRKYELERLGYFYAVVVCDSKQSAYSIYEECDGFEFESTANKFDLRFIPEDTSFDEDVPRDSAAEVPAGYKPPALFESKASKNTKVQLTWDETDPLRREALMKEHKADEDDDNLNAYLASDNDDVTDAEGAEFGDDIGSEDAEDDAPEGAGKPKKPAVGKSVSSCKQAKARAKYASLLGILNEGIEESPVEIVFKPKLEETGQKILASVKENKEQSEKSPWARFLEKKKQKKKAAKKEHKAKQSGSKSSGHQDANEDGLGGSGSEEAAEMAELSKDAFFADAYDDDEYEDPNFHKQDKPSASNGKNKMDKQDKNTKKVKIFSIHPECAHRVVLIHLWICVPVTLQISL